jgi:hypothetical protein
MWQAAVMTTLKKDSDKALALSEAQVRAACVPLSPERGFPMPMYHTLSGLQVVDLKKQVEGLLAQQQEAIKQVSWQYVTCNRYPSGPAGRWMFTPCVGRRCWQMAALREAHKTTRFVLEEKRGQVSVSAHAELA